MTNFDDKIFYLKNILAEDGVAEVLEQIKLMLIHNKQRLNEVIQLETRLNKLNNDFRFQFITKEAFDSQYALLIKTVLDYLDEITPEDLQPKTEKTRKKKNGGHLLRRIPKEMQLFTRTKCVIRLAHLQEDLLENYQMTDDTEIKSVRVAEVMEVDLQDRNEEKSFEITTPNSKEQFLDEDYYTEWIFYVKPIKEGKHELTLVISVLEEVRGKERRRDVVLEEVVTIVTEDIVVDDVYKSTGYQVGSSKTIAPQPFLGFKNFRKYAAVLGLLIIGTLGIWAFTTESGQYQMANWQNTKLGFERFIKKHETPNTSRFVIKAKGKLELKIYEEAVIAAENGQTELLLAFVNDYPESQYKSEAIDKLITTDYNLIVKAKKDRSIALIDFIKRYQHIDTPTNKKMQTKAKIKYEVITNQRFSLELLNNSKIKPLEIKGLTHHLLLDKKQTIDTVSTTSNRLELKKIEQPTTKKTPTIITKKQTPKTTKKPQTTIKKEAITPTYSKDIFARQMVRVQGGKFTMGNKKGKSNEKPEHLIELETFSISKYEVTQKQWREVMEKDHKNYHKNCDNCPVDNISWKTANDFIQKLNEKTGKNYRLPTEAEWEYAAKGGQISKNYKYAGSNDLKNIGWYSQNSRKTQPVGSKPPNELNLHDMSGNVYEWCSDWYDKDFYKNSPTSNPKNTNSGNGYHVLRGGSWYNNSKYCRITARRTNTESNKNTSNGFRLVHD